MRAKLFILAAGAALLLVGLVVFSESATEVTKTQSETTLSRQGAPPEAKAKADAAGRRALPNVMKGGPGRVNQNLRQLKNDLQQQMDARPGHVDERVGQATGER